MRKNKNKQGLLKIAEHEPDYGAISEEEVELSAVATSGVDGENNVLEKSGESTGSSGSTFSPVGGAEGAGTTLPGTGGDGRGFTLAWRKLDVFAEVKKPWYRRFRRDAVSVKVHILRSVSGYARSGNVLAILGTSGSGKSRLLDVLSCRDSNGLQIKGDVTLNGQPIGKRIRALSSRADEQKCFIGMLTVREYLSFYALLSMDGGGNAESVRRKVQDILDELGLTRCADYQVQSNGSHNKLSDGEQCKLSFACKILNDKEIMFCDDVTSGMDTLTSMTVIGVLKKLAKTGNKIIICTFKQPPSGVYDMLTKVMYLAEGRVAYFGESKTALTFFEQIGYKSPNNYNPADYIVQTLGVVPYNKHASYQQVEGICNKYESTLYYKKLLKKIALTDENPSQDKLKHGSLMNVSICRAPYSTQMCALLWRFWLSTIRDPRGMRMIIILILVMGLLLGCIYFQQTYNQNAVINVNGVLLFMVLQAASTPLFISTIKYPSLLPHVLQDVRNGMYHLFPVFIIVLLFELVVCSVGVTVYASIVYWMSGLSSHALAFLTCVGALLLAAHASLSIGHVIVAASPGPASAVTIATALVPPAMLFTGLFVHLPTIPAVVSWVPYLSWCRYAFGILVVDQWQHISVLECQHSNGTAVDDSTCITSGAGVIQFMGFEDDTLPDDLLSAVFTAVLDDVKLDPTLVEDICVGNVRQPGAGAAMARIAQFFSGIPYTVPLHTTNRQCSSGLQACMTVAAHIKAGFVDIGIGAGVESLSVNPMNERGSGFVLNPKVMDLQVAKDTLIPMGITSENVAERFGISREKQDRMAVESHAKAAAAQKNGLFDAEIVPVKTKIKDKDGNEREIVVSQDDGVRPATTMEILAKLKPAFTKGGSTTAGNASQVSDGAGAVIMARRSRARELGLPVLGVVRAYSVVGVPPDVMGIGPAYAIPAVLKKAGLGINDIEIFEINEAFASQATYSVEKVGIPMHKVNPKGGAIALGHPLGCTGARQIGTLLHELKRRAPNKKSYGVVSMCMGTGMGAAAVFEYPGK